MFRARRFAAAELPPAKRHSELLSPPAAAPGKRQRLQLAAAEAYFLQDHQLAEEEPLSAELHNHHHDHHHGQHQQGKVLIETPECTVAALAALPTSLAEELRRAGCARVLACRAAAGGRHSAAYLVTVLRTKLVLWHEELARVIALPLPDELDDREVLQPFLLALDGQSLSLLAVGRSGIVLFWEDIELPYESVPLSLQIPLQHDEEVFTAADAVLVAATAAYDSDAQRQEDEDLKSVLCWSNQGNVWEVAMEDRRIRVRAFEKRSGGFLAGLTRSVSQFFFASSAARAGGGGPGHYGAGGELDANLPIKYVKAVPSAADAGGDAAVDESADMVVLFSNGVVERRTFSTGDVMDCSCASVRHFDASRVAISYFSDNFPEQHLAKVEIVSLPYVLDSCFALLVAFVCTSRHDAVPVVKYAVFQFALGSASESSEPEWVCVLDYEPVFAEEDSSRYFQVECFGVARGAFYLVWTKAVPIQFASLLLPRAGQTSVRYAAFSLQGVPNRSAVGFSARVEANAFAGDAIKGSVSFVLLEDEIKQPGGTLCVATAANMQKVEALLPTPQASLSTASLEKSRKRLEEVSRATGENPRLLVNNQDVQEYMRLLTTHFRDDAHSSSPLRIGAADVLAVAQAAVAIDFQILDAKPSSGLRWGQETTDAVRGAKKSDSTTANVAHVTPKLVRFQLEEKRARRAEFLAFLQRRCATVWQAIVKSPELSRYLAEDGEKLNAAISLSRFQGALHSAASTPSSAGAESDGALSSSLASMGSIQRRLTGEFLLHAIEKTVEARGYQKEQLRLAGYNAFDVFYCEVSKITELFQHLSVEIGKLSTSIGESDPTYLRSLLEAGYSMLSMLKPSSVSSEAQASSPFPPTGSWAFTRQVREVLVDQISRLTVLVGYSSSITDEKHIRWESDEIFEATDQIKSIGTILLDGYLGFLPSLQGEEAEDLRKELELSKRYVLNPLVYVATNTALGSTIGSSVANLEQNGFLERKRNELFALCVKLSEKYSYYESMVFLAYIEDLANLSKLDYVLGKAPRGASTKRLEAYCKAYDGFPQFLFSWYSGEVHNPWPVSSAFEKRARAAMLAYMLGNSKLFGASLHQYMSKHEDLAKHCWVSALSIERYDQTAAFALHEAEREHSSLVKRKNLASLAKIAALAAPDTTRNEDNLQQINRELARMRIQEMLQQLPLEHAVDVRPLGTEELVDVCLEASSSVEKSDPVRTSLFLMALEAVESVDPESPEFGAALAKTWRHCLLGDTELWENLLEEHASGVNEQKLEQLMRQTLLFSAMKQYVSRRRQQQQQGEADVAPAALTAELIDDLIEHEEHEESIIGVRSRQLFSKTLSFALSAH